MKTELKIKLQILKNTYAGIDISPDKIESMWKNSDEKWDIIQEFRGGEVETDIPCEFSRHYESKSVAAKLDDGSWVGWTYWYGGGKHGEPEAVDWMDSAYELDCTETEKLVVVREFKKK